MEFDGGIQQLLVRRGDSFLVLMYDPLNRQVMLRDGVGVLVLLLQMLAEDGLILGEEGRRPSTQATRRSRCGG